MMLVDDAGRWRPGSTARILHAVALCLLQPIVPIATLVVFRGPLFGPDGLRGQLAASTLLGVAAAAALSVTLVVGLGLCAVGRVGPRALGWRRDPRGEARTILLGLTGAVAATASLFGALALFGNDAARALLDVLSWSPSQRALFAIVGLAVALFEETLFRGYLQPALAARVGPRAAVVLVAGFYAVYHPPAIHAVSVVARFGQGLVYGALRGRDGSLLAPALAHFAYWTLVGLY